MDKNYYFKIYYKVNLEIKDVFPIRIAVKPIDTPAILEVKGFSFAIFLPFLPSVLVAYACRACCAIWARVVQWGRAKSL